MKIRRNRAFRRAAAERVLAQLEPSSGGEAPSGIHEDAALTTEIQAMRAITDLLEEVPPEAWARIPESGAAHAASSPATDRRPRPIRLSRGLVGVVAAVCLALGFAGGAVLESGGGSSPAPAPAHQGPAVVLHPLSSASSNSLAVAYMPGPGQMVLRVVHLAPSPPGTYYELWLMTDVKHLLPVSAFRIGPTSSAQLSLRLPDNSHRYAYLDISVQRIGGGTAHSGDSVVRGRLA